MAKASDNALGGNVSSTLSGSKHRVGNLGILFWLGIAILLDLLQFVLLFLAIGLVFNRLLGLIFSVSFFLYAWLIGIRLIRPGRLLALAMLVADTVIPGVGGILPLLSIGTGLVIAESRVGEALGTIYPKRAEEKARKFGRKFRRGTKSIISRG